MNCCKSESDWSRSWQMVVMPLPKAASTLWSANGRPPFVQDAARRFQSSERSSQARREEQQTEMPSSGVRGHEVTTFRDPQARSSIFHTHTAKQIPPNYCSCPSTSTPICTTKRPRFFFSCKGFVLFSFLHTSLFPRTPYASLRNFSRLPSFLSFTFSSRLPARRVPSL